VDLCWRKELKLRKPKRWRLRSTRLKLLYLQVQWAKDLCVQLQ
jgi:hypothetical protein